jgi:quercetin 2,3-dioxygenase
MSGPVSTEDTPPDAPDAPPRPSPAPVVEITPSHEATVGITPVRRALPRRARRTVGAWCFADHMGPVDIRGERGIDIGPHPHIGLHTVTWLLDGELLHRDSLGTEQLIRPGQLNLMTAGHGIAHAEEGTGRPGRLHGMQLWVAQPAATRDGPSAFEHHSELPRFEATDASGRACGVVTVLVGAIGSVRSPARADTELVGAELDLSAGPVELPLNPRFEHALIVLSGAVSISDEQTPIAPGRLAWLGTGREALAVSPSGGRAMAMLIGGVPFEEPLTMWWNYVAPGHDAISQAHQDWTTDSGRFGSVTSTLSRMPSPPPPWM